MIGECALLASGFLYNVFGLLIPRDPAITVKHETEGC